MSLSAGDRRTSRLFIDAQQRRVLLGSCDVDLTAREFHILCMLAAHEGWVFSREQLAAEEPHRLFSPASVGVHVAHLRRKLAEAGGVGIVETVRGVGFRLRPGTMTASAPEARSSLLGREREMGELLGALSAARQGEGQAVFIVGEPGSGKTHCVRELIRQARDQGFLVAELHCRDEASPGDSAGTRPLRELRTALEARLATSPEETPQADRSPSAELLTLLDRTLCREAALIVAEDLDQAPDAALAFVQKLTEQLDHLRMLVAGTFRESATSTPLLGQLVSRAVGSGRCVFVHVHGLSKSAVSELISARLGFGIDPAASAAVHEVTGGNPFFVGEVVQMLSDDDAWDCVTCERIQTIHPTPKLQGMVSWLLEPLSSQSRIVLETAAVAGPDVCVPVIEAVESLESAALLDLLDEAITARVLVERSPGELSFRVPLVRHVLCHGLNRANRMRLHGRIGETLVDLAFDGDVDHAACAYHFRAAASAGYAREAIKHSILAARSARKRSDFAAAVNEYRVGLETLESIALEPTETHEARAALEGELLDTLRLRPG